jgi:hypothetical protein
MPTALLRRFDRLEAQRLELLRRVDAYSDAQQAFQPAPESWSLAGVIHHLVLVEETLVGHGRRTAASRPARVTLRARVRERVILSVLARDIRVRAPSPALLPPTHVPIALLGPRWVAARQDLLDYLTRLPGPAWSRSAFYHPRAGWITAAGGLRFLWAHTRHHGRQIDRIVAADGFPP